MLVLKCNDIIVKSVLLPWYEGAVSGFTVVEAFGEVADDVI